MKPFLPKDDQRLPDYYGVKIEDITGKVREYKVAGHTWMVEIRAIELYLFEDEYIVIPLDNVIISFDKQFSKVVKLKQELEESKSQPKKRGNNPNGSTKAEC